MKLQKNAIRLGLMVAAYAAVAVGFRAMLSVDFAAFWHHAANGHVLAGLKAMFVGHLPAMFEAPEEDLSFAWFVPIFSLYVLYSERAKLKASLGDPSLAGLVAALPFIFLGFLGARGLQVRFELIAFVGLLISIPWAVFGRRTAERVLFPAAFLLFCMPLNSYLSLITVHLRLLVSAVSADILSGVGMDIVREGNLISLPSVVIGGEQFVIDIANPCSGLRSILALLALSAGYGYFNQPTWGRRAILFALAIPCAVAGNVLRIMSICVVARFCNADFALGFYHDIAGFVVFIVAIGLLVGAGEIINAIFKDGGRRSEDAPAPADKASAPEEGRSNAAVAVPYMTLAVVVAAMSWQAMSPKPVIAEAPDAELPAELAVPLGSAYNINLDGERFLRLPAGNVAFKGEPIEPSVAETNLLVGAKLSKRSYTQGAVDVDTPALFTVSTVVSGPNKQSLHRPELCLPSQGLDMASDSSIRVGDVVWHVIGLSAKGGRGAALFAYTFYNQEGYRTDSHESRILRDVWDRTIRNLVDRWVMVTVQLNVPDERLLRSVLMSLKEVVE